VKLSYVTFRRQAVEVLADGRLLSASEIVRRVPMVWAPTPQEAASVMKKDPQFTFVLQSMGATHGAWKLTEGF